MTTYTIKNNNYFKSLEISFNEKPSEQIRNILKEYRFRWNHTLKIWYGFANKDDITSRLDSILKPVKVEKPVKKAAAKTEKPAARSNKVMLTKQQEKALLKLNKYNWSGCKRKENQPERRIYAVKDNYAFIGNSYALIKVNLDYVSEETKEELKKASELCRCTYDSVEKIFNNAVKQHKENRSDSYTLSDYTEIKNEDGLSFYQFKNNTTFEKNLYKTVAAFFPKTASINCLPSKKTTPSIINMDSKDYEAIICPLFRY